MPHFFFSDIEGSTRLWEKFPEKMQIALRRHDDIIETAIKRRGGRIIKHTGDGYFAVFEDSTAIIQAALDIQTDIHSHVDDSLTKENNQTRENQAGEENRENADTALEIRVRIGLHTGEATSQGDDYFGPAVNRTARIMSAGWGGQILLTPELLDAAELPQDSHTEDLGFHMLKDLSEPVRIFNLRHPELKLRTFPVLKTLSARPNNLPRQDTPFVGRRNDLDLLAKTLLDSPERLLTLLGPGGMGKTRLAAQLGAEHIEHFYHGVYFVSLAPLTAGDQIVSAIADSLKLNFYGDRPPLTQLQDYLREKEVLLILDNFEHIMEGANLVSELLENAPALRVLVTSREKLNLSQERTHPVGGMRFPTNGVPTAAEYDAFSAIKLFVQSAGRIRPDFSFEQSGEAVVRICELVQGMPLAIELAATWLFSLEIDEILEELKEGMDFLETRMRDVPERHRSLRAVFNYSWNLLDNKEQSTLAALSVFPGSFTRPGAKAVASANLNILTTLMDKSLIHRNSEGRYHLHSLLRSYAAEKPANPEETSRPDPRDLALDKLTEYYAAFLGERKIYLWRMPHNLDTVEEIREELDNILAALDRLFEHEMNETLAGTLDIYLRCICAFYETLGRLPDGGKLFGIITEKIQNTGITLASSLAERRVMSLAFSIKAWFANRAMRLDLARQAADAARNILGDDIVNEEYCMHQVTEAFWCYLKGDYAKSREISIAALDTARQADVNWIRGFTYTHISYLSFIRGEYEQALQYGKEALQFQDRDDSRAGQGFALNNIAEAERALGKLSDARKNFESALEQFQKYKINFGAAFVLINLAELDLDTGDYSRARLRFAESMEMNRDAGDRRGISQAYKGQGDTELCLKNYEGALEYYEEARRILADPGDTFRIADIYLQIGEVRTIQGDIPGAESELLKAMELALEAHAPGIILRTLLKLAHLTFLSGNAEQALELVALIPGRAAALPETLDAAEKLLQDLRGQLGQEPVEEVLSKSVTENGGEESIEELERLIRSLKIFQAGINFSR